MLVEVYKVLLEIRAPQLEINFKADLVSTTALIQEWYVDTLQTWYR